MSCRRKPLLSKWRSSVPRWTVRIEGAPFDIEDYPDWFPKGPVRAVKREDGVNLLADGFEQLADSTQVHEAALGLLDELFSVVSILQPNLQKPTIATVFREEEDGRRQGFVQVSARISARSKVRGSATVVGKEAEPSRAVLRQPSVSYWVSASTGTWTRSRLSGQILCEPGRGSTAFWKRSSRTWAIRCQTRGGAAATGESSSLGRRTIPQPLVPMLVTPGGMRRQTNL